MKIKIKLTLPGRLNPPDRSAEFELTGHAWTVNTEKLAGSAGDVAHDHGSRSMIRRLADIDPALVDDFRRTL